MNKIRVAAGLLVAPLFTPFVFCAALESLKGSPTTVVIQFFRACLGMSPFIYGAEVLLGIPMWVLFLHFRIRGVLAFAAGGALIGLIVAVILGALARTPLSEILNPWSSGWVTGGVPLGILAAAGSAFVFRIIAYPGRKCRDHAEPLPTSV